MSRNVPTTSFLVIGSFSTLGFFLGVSGLGILPGTGLDQSLLSSLLYLLLTLICVPFLVDRLRYSAVSRGLVCGLVALSVVPLTTWILGVRFAWSSVALGVLLATCFVELGGMLERRFLSGETGLKPRATSVLIVGAGEAGEMLLRELRHQPGLHRDVIGFLDDDPAKQGASLDGVPVLGTTDDLVGVCRNTDVDEVIIAMPSVDGEVIRSVVGQRSSIQADMRIVPGIREIIEGDFHWNQIRPVRPEDLLGRETVEVDRDRIRDFLRGRKVLVTGAAGSIGSYLVREILEYPVKEVLGLDYNESDLYELEVSELKNTGQTAFTSVLGDIRDSKRCDEIVADFRPDLILHAAALKHVPMVERFPLEGVRTNVSGCLNVFDAAREHGVEHCLLISTDKAVNPKNVMGYTKRMGEQLVGTYQGLTDTTRYAAVRFGNVLGSRGSVVPLFKRQIEEGGPVTVTDPEMVRYFMTPTEAVKLVLTAASFSDGGNTYVLDIGDPISIMDLARQLIALMGYQPGTEIPIEIVGLREGESLEEKLLEESESPRTTPHPEIQRVELEGIRGGSLDEFREFLESSPADTGAFLDNFKGYLNRP